MGAGIGRGQGSAVALTPSGSACISSFKKACYDTHLQSDCRADVSVAPQLGPEAMAEAKAAGFRSVINNRPDFEGGASQPTNASIEAAARAAGLEYAFLPVADLNFQTPEEIARYGAARVAANCTIIHTAVQGARARASSGAPPRAADLDPPLPQDCPTPTVGQARTASWRKHALKAVNAATRYPPPPQNSAAALRIPCIFPGASSPVPPPPLITLSRLIDRCSEWIGRWLAWLVLVAVLISHPTQNFSPLRSPPLFARPLFFPPPRQSPARTATWRSSGTH